MIEHFLPVLFLNHEIISSGCYRVVRNADLTIDEEEASDLLKEIEKQLKLRQRGQVIKFEYSRGMDRRLVRYPKKQFQIGAEQLVCILY